MRSLESPTDADAEVLESLVNRMLFDKLDF